ncbi:MAG: hypothetical protein GY754_02350 [bacterium]|nr:hypothetical protein [bacterium]
MIKKNLFYAFLCLFIALAATQLFASDVDTYQSSWEHKAFTQQRNLDLHAPLKDAVFFGTHNSYNASAYTNAGSYWDPNQIYSIYDQLRLESRFLELDVHYWFSMDGWPWEWKTKLLLSHGQEYVGASSFDRELSEGLSEINSWIRQAENSGEVLMLYFEDYMDGEYGKFVDALENSIGDLVYKPGTCQNIPVNLSKADILNSGKQIIIVSGNCNNSTYAQWVYNNSWTGGSKSDPCSSVAANPDKMVRIFEDRTNLSEMVGDPTLIDAAMMGDIADCGINIQNLDDLAPDSRLTNAIWSWDTNEPNDWGGNEDCAVQKSNGRFNDANCANSYYYACKDSSGTWFVPADTGAWSSGDSVCSAAGGTFEAPVNGYDNTQLLTVKSVSNVWINYSDTAVEGTWVTKDGAVARFGSTAIESCSLECHEEKVGCNTETVCENICTTVVQAEASKTCRQECHKEKVGCNTETVCSTVCD